MNRDAEKIADAILYEGYILYPYRRSAVKNQQRWSVGTLYPPACEEVKRGTESPRMHSEFLMRAGETTQLRIRLRFLHLHRLQPQRPSGEMSSTFDQGIREPESWDEGTPRTFDMEVAPVQASAGWSFCFGSGSIKDDGAGTVGRALVNEHELVGRVEFSSQAIGSGVLRCTLEVMNESALGDESAQRSEVLLRSLLSAHCILEVEDGEFVSLLEPPEELQQAAGACVNHGNFPVLLGGVGAHDALLCSPILLYDYPQIAPESGGDFFDATEMDEMLTLRVLTLSDAEKSEIRGADPRADALLRRVEESALDQLTRTHGAIRSLRPAAEER